MKTKTEIHAGRMYRALLCFVILCASDIPTQAAQAGDNCDVDKVPAEIQQLLKKEFPSLHYETLADVNQEHRDVWLKAHPSDCPGVATGEFRRRGEVSYAFLLVPPDPKNGFKLIVLAKGPSGYNVKTLFEVSIDYHFDVISRVPPGEHARVGGKTRVHFETDGIQLQTMDVGTRIFYWAGDRYRSIVVSD